MYYIKGFVGDSVGSSVNGIRSMDRFELNNILGSLLERNPFLTSICLFDICLKNSCLILMLYHTYQSRWHINIRSSLLYYVIFKLTNFKYKDNLM